VREGGEGRERGREGGEGRGGGRGGGGGKKGVRREGRAPGLADREGATQEWLQMACTRRRKRQRVCADGAERMNTWAQCP